MTIKEFAAIMFFNTFIVTFGVISIYVWIKFGFKNILNFWYQVFTDKK